MLDFLAVNSRQTVIIVIQLINFWRWPFQKTLLTSVPKETTMDAAELFTLE